MPGASDNPLQIIESIWERLALPPSALDQLHLPSHKRPLIPSSYKITGKSLTSIPGRPPVPVHVDLSPAHARCPSSRPPGLLPSHLLRQPLRGPKLIEDLAQASIGLSTLATSLIQSQRLHAPLRQVTVEPKHAIAEFSSEKFNYVNGKGPGPLWGPFSGLYECQDGYVRIHDSFINHRLSILSLLRLEEGATREDVENKIKLWKKAEFEEKAWEEGFAAYALRTEEEWVQTKHARVRRPHCT